MNPSDNIKYVFVVMLENHSFDVMLGLSGLPGVTSPAGNRNVFKGETPYRVQGQAPTTLTTDPGHELEDTLQQLTNKQQSGNTPPYKWSSPLGPYSVPLGPYPKRDFPADFKNETGFVNNYVYNNDEDNPNPPGQDHYGDTLKCFTPDQLPVLNKLASEFAYCTNWFSSIPGPTWPNRFFLHFASSGGMDCSPTQAQIDGWAEPGQGFDTPRGSIFKALTNKGLNYRVYNDCWADFWTRGYSSCFSNDPDAANGMDGGGWVPQVAALQDIAVDSWYELQYYFPGHLAANDYNVQYVFIEPHYGNIAANTYKGGSSQHPMDDIYGGEALVKFVYETIRAQEDVWQNSLLIVTYDEHGGFYDSVAPPTAVPPDDGSPGYGQPNTLNQFGFQFDQAGVRVPAVIVSPWIAKGVVDNTTYDHTSVLKTLETLFGLNALTARDRAATDVLGLVTNNFRSDCPTQLPEPAPPSDIRVPPLTTEEIAAIDRSPLPESGNIIGTLGILRKLHYEVSSKNFITRWFIRWRARRVKTKGDFKAYSRRVAKKIEKRTLAKRALRK